MFSVSIADTFDREFVGLADRETQASLLSDYRGCVLKTFCDRLTK